MFIAFAMLIFYFSPRFRAAIAADVFFDAALFLLFHDIFADYFRCHYYAMPLFACLSCLLDVAYFHMPKRATRCHADADDISFCCF